VCVCVLGGPSITDQAYVEQKEVMATCGTLLFVY